MDAINIQVAESVMQLIHCYPVMAELRSHLTESEFISQVQRQQAAGYMLVYLEDRGVVKALAGFRLLEMLSRGKFMYVDDLVTLATARSQGYGDRLFDWLVDYARRQGCARLDLDSGVQRAEAHRFYFRKRMVISGYHFELEL